MMTDKRIKQLAGYLEAVLKGETLTDEQATSLCLSFGQNTMPSKETQLSTQHAHSLIRLVKWFKTFVPAGNMPGEAGRSDELTVGYCNELLAALGAEGCVAFKSEPEPTGNPEVHDYANTGGE